VVAIGGNALLRGGTHATVVETDGGGCRGVEAVIDKGLTSVHLAAEVGADLLVITTGVERVAVDYGRTTQRYLDRLTRDEAERLLAQGRFPPGSMGPKIRAALDFLRGAPGRQVLITPPQQLGAALDGRGGIWLDSEPARTTEEPLNGTVTAGRPQ
jgi:carbamate kinase